MEKYSRNERISAITRVMTEHPNKIINLNVFTEMLNAAKSSISEDLLVVKEALGNLSLGKVETIAGAAGGVRYRGIISPKESKDFVSGLCKSLNTEERIIAGFYLYMTDIMWNPDIIHKAALILSSAFTEKKVDYVVTVETKGIPLAYEVARNLGVQLVVVRRDPTVTEGTTVSINYLTGSSKRIQTMSLSKKAMKKGSKCIFIDDFMKAGGTTIGIIELMKEFESEVIGIGVLIDDVSCEKKMVTDYITLLDFNGINEQGKIEINPSSLFK